MKNRLDVKVSLFQNCKASGMPVREIFLCDFFIRIHVPCEIQNNRRQVSGRWCRGQKPFKNESPCRYGKRNIQQAEQCGVDRPQRSDLH